MVKKKLKYEPPCLQSIKDPFIALCAANGSSAQGIKFGQCDNGGDTNLLVCSPTGNAASSTGATTTCSNGYEATNGSAGTGCGTGYSAAPETADCNDGVSAGSGKGVCHTTGTSAGLSV